MSVVSDQNRNLRSYVAYGVVVGAWLAYMLMLLFASHDNTSSIHIGLTLTNVIRLSFTLPILFIWLIATRAALQLTGYAKVIADSPEGPGLKWLGRGLFGMLAYMILLIVLGRVAPLFNHTQWLTLAVFLKNHLPVYTLLAAAACLYIGSLRFSRLKGDGPSGTLNWAWVGYSIFALAFAVVFISHPDNPKTLSDSIPTFSVTHEVLLFTLILPSLMAWALMLVACIQLASFAKSSKGVIYKTAFTRLIAGIYTSAGFSIFVELLVLNTALLQKVGLAAILLIIYVFIFAYGVGAVLIARGTRKLLLIEGVV